MLYFLLTLIALWVVWKIVRYEIERRRERRFVERALAPGAGIGVQSRKIADWRAAHPPAAQGGQNERIQAILKATPWRMRGAMRAHLKKRIQLGYDI